MNLFNMFHKAKKVKQAVEDKISNKSVHDDKNKFTSQMSKIERQARKMNKKIKSLKADSEELQKLLTITEKVWLGSGGHK